MAEVFVSFPTPHMHHCPSFVDALSTQESHLGGHTFRPLDEPSQTPMVELISFSNAVLSPGMFIAIHDLILAKLNGIDLEIMYTNNYGYTTYPS